MRQIKKRGRAGRRTVTLIIIAGFLALLIPLFIIALYAHPSVDDYSYGWYTSQAWRETGSLFNVLSAAARYTSEIYGGWQGSFSAVFLMTLQPAVFSYGLYALTAFLMLGFLILSSFFFSYIVIKKILNADNVSFFLAALAPLALSIQLVPSPVQAYFWFNGAIYYTFFYSLSLIFISLILSGFVSKCSVPQCIVMILLGAFIGGGNYTTALFTSVVALTLTVCAFVKHSASKYAILTACLFMLAAFAVSVLAPGNAVRQASSQSMPPVETILMSFATAFEHIGKWTTLPFICLFILMLPVAAACVKNAGYTFKFPILFTVFSLCVFAAQFAPPLYSMSSAGPPRLTNIIFFSYYPLVMLNLIYYMGWIKHRLKLELNVSGAVRKTVLALAIGAFAVSCYFNRQLMASYNAVSQLRDGSVHAYHAEQLTRQDLYTTSSSEDLILNGFTVKPAMLFFDDITNDPSDWRNAAVARYYNKRSVRLR